MVSGTDDTGTGIFVRFPLPEQRLFRNRATEDILLLFARNPHEEFTVTELRDVTGHGGDTVGTAIEVLSAADLVETRSEGRKRLVSANRDRFTVPEDPLLSVPQEEFRSPLKAFLDELDRVDAEVVGVVLFGSVARGRADRTSDIDLQVVVDGDLLTARRDLHAVRQEIEGQRFDGHRYEFELLVESTDSVESYGEKLREIYSEGIVLRGSDRLTELKRGVFSGE